MNTVFEGEAGVRVRKAALAVLVLLAVFLAAKTVAELQGLRYIGAGTPPSNVVTVNGEGEAFARPDIAEFTYSVVEKRATVSAAQEEAVKKSDAILGFLKGEGIEEKDIRTTGYSVYPVYEWQQAVCPAGALCPSGRQVLTGYEVRESIQVKVRESEKAGALLSGVGSKGATEVSGLSFTLDDEDEVRAQARAAAIADAKEKAEVLERELGVRFKRIVSFNEYTNKGYPPTPYYGYGRGGDLGVAEAGGAPQLPSGENTFTSQVTIVYEIR